eukprot:1076866-Pleurochrysis_carterae.AAC.1
MNEFVGSCPNDFVRTLPGATRSDRTGREGGTRDTSTDLRRLSRIAGSGEAGRGGEHVIGRWRYVPTHRRRPRMLG